VARSSYLFTSESVSEGHPDKVCDQISDGVLDLFLKEDPYARVACETLTTTNRVVIAGEVRGPKSLVSKSGAVNKKKIEEVARTTIKKIGYEQKGFHWKTAKVDVLLHGQSADIAVGVDSAGNKDEGAGDQGIMFGYATNETPELMPAPLQLSHNILSALAAVRHSGKEPLLGPDAKSQVTLLYKNGKPTGATAIVVSTQHAAKDKKGRELESGDIKRIVKPYVQKVMPKGWMCDDEHFYVNPTGRFVIGGPDGDCGLTGRKIIVDTYGGAAPHGGGAFSGKDPTKVDRSAAYVARYLAKNVVAAGLSDKCLIQLSYAIGELVKLSPRGIREHLKLNRAIYARTAAYGHFGRKPEKDGGFSWEKTDLVKDLKSAFNVR
jgi:S-adenosylmethionine synthetase